MVSVPSFILKRLYVKGSLSRTDDGFGFTVRNQLGSGFAYEMLPLTLDGQPFPLEACYFRTEEGIEQSFSDVSGERPFTLQMGKSVFIGVREASLTSGPHKIGLGFVVQGIGPLQFEVSDVAE
jgi:hydroxymethylglutaryl-CoA reductase (NADPH)